MKRMLCAVIALCISLSAGQVFAATISGPFSDVPSSYWAHEYIQFLKDNNIANGYDDGTFKPERNISRAEITKMAMMASHLRLHHQVDGAFSNFVIDSQYFPDVAQNHPLRKYIALAYSRGLLDDSLSPYPDYKFYPETSADRFFTLKLLLDALGLTRDVQYHTSSVSAFTDVTSDEEIKYTQYAKDKGIIQGYGDGTYGPKDPVRRSEMAKIIKNAITTFDAVKGKLSGTLTVTGTCSSNAPFTLRVLANTNHQDYWIVTDISVAQDGSFHIDLPPGSYAFDEVTNDISLRGEEYVVTTGQTTAVTLSGSCAS